MLYQIGDFSRITRLSIKTLRFYDEEGILVPSSRNEMTGYRRYDDEAVERAGVIRQLRELDFSLKEIREMLAGMQDDGDLIPFMERKADELSKKIADQQAARTKILRFVDHQKETALMKVDENITIKMLPDMTIASIRFSGKYGEVGPYFSRIAKVAGRYIRGPALSLYHDGDYREEGADIEPSFMVKSDARGDGDVTVRHLAGGEAVTVLHKGSYETIGESYRKLFGFITSHSMEQLLPIREIYIKGPGTIFKGNPNAYITELQILVKQ